MLVALQLIFSKSVAQQADTIWYNTKWEKTSKEQMEYYRVIQKEANDSLYHANDYYQNGNVQMEGGYLSFDPEVRQGLFTWFFPSGVKRETAMYEHNQIMKYKRWDETGHVTKQFETLNTIQTKDGKNTHEFTIIEVAPEFPGGIKALYAYIADHVRVQADAEKARIKGKVIIKFIIDQTGKATDAEVVQPLYPSLDEEALRLVRKMPRWKPGQQEGKPVRVTYQLPIAFNYQ